MFPVFNYIFTGNILGMWEKRGFTPHAEVLLPSEPVSQCICTKLSKTDDNETTRKNNTNTLS